MLKLTKSLLVIKERNCGASLVLDTRTNRKNVSEYPLAIRFTVDRKFFYHHVGGSYSEKRFSDICNATKSSSENYKEQKMWREEMAMQMGCVDAGNVSENINLYCQSVGLVTVPRATHDTEGIKKLLGFTDKQLPIMNNPVGYPKK